MILSPFLAEATLLSVGGGVLGLAIGFGLAQLLRLLVPGLPVQTPVLYAAACLDPVEALGAE